MLTLRETAAYRSLTLTRYLSGETRLWLSFDLMVHQQKTASCIDRIYLNAQRWREPPADSSKTPRFDDNHNLHDARRLPTAKGGSALRVVVRFALQSLHR